MKFYTHKRISNIEDNTLGKVLISVVTILVSTVFCFIGIVCSICSNSLIPAAIMFLFIALFMLSIWSTNKDINNAFVKFDNEVVTVVDYYFGIKRVKVFFKTNIGFAEILVASSLRVRGNRYSILGMQYIVVSDKNGKYMFKTICTAEAKEFFNQYLK